MKRRRLTPEQRQAKRKQRTARAKLRGAHPRVHRFAFAKRKNLWGELKNDASRPRISSKTACGLSHGYYGSAVAIDDASFAWLPATHQCENCRWKQPRALTPDGVPSGTPLHVTTVETIVLEFARLGEAARDVPHADRGCYFDHDRASGRRVCHCGRTSLTDQARERVDLLVAGEYLLLRVKESLRRQSPLEQAAIERLQREHDEMLAAARADGWPVP
jgi:hypothetical protein